jgi:hypothetical protein
MFPPSHSEVFAEVHTAYVGVVDDVLRSAFRQHAPLADDVGVVANAQRFAHVVIGDEYANAALFQEGNDALNFNDGNGINAPQKARLAK